MKDGSGSHKIRISYEDISNYQLKDGDLVDIEIVRVVRNVKEDEEWSANIVMLNL